jgi:hypothetical protein
MKSEISRHILAEEAEVARRSEIVAETAKAEREETLQPSRPAKEGETGPVEIPDSAPVRMARQFLQMLPSDATAETMEKAAGARGILLSTPVRKALVQEEARRRANRQEDQAQAGMTAQTIPAEQTREALQVWVDGVAKGEKPYARVPKDSDFVPANAEKLERTKVVGAGKFSGTYYHSEEVSGADIRKAARDKHKPQSALNALEAKWKGVEVPVELVEQSRSVLRQRAPQLLTLLLIAAGTSTWLYQSHEVKRRAAEAAEAAAAAREVQARLVVARVRNAWNAADDWEDALPSENAAFATYTIELENALIKGRPIVAFGLVDDVRKPGEQDNSTVLFQDIGRTKGMDLRFALLSAPATTKGFLDHKDRSSNMFVFAATITSVEKVAMPPDSNGNDQDYFLAHGILHEAQSIGFRDQPPKK